MAVTGNFLSAGLNMSVQSGAAARPRSASHPRFPQWQGDQQSSPAGHRALEHAAPSHSAEPARSVEANHAQMPPPPSTPLAAPGSFQGSAPKTAVSQVLRDAALLPWGIAPHVHASKFQYQRMVRITPPITPVYLAGIFGGQSMTLAAFTIGCAAAAPPVFIAGMISAGLSLSGTLVCTALNFRALPSRSHLKDLLKAIVQNFELWVDDVSLDDINALAYGLSGIRVYAYSEDDCAHRNFKRIDALITSRRSTLIRPDCKSAIDAIASSKTAMTNATFDELNAEANRIRSWSEKFSDDTAKEFCRRYADKLSKRSALTKVKARVEQVTQGKKLDALDALSDELLSTEILDIDQSGSDVRAALLRDVHEAARACREKELEQRIKEIVQANDPNEMRLERDRISALETGLGKPSINKITTLIDELWMAEVGHYIDQSWASIDIAMRAADDEYSAAIQREYDEDNVARLRDLFSANNPASVAMENHIKALRRLYQTSRRRTKHAAAENAAGANAVPLVALPSLEVDPVLATTASEAKADAIARFIESHWTSIIDRKNNAVSMREYLTGASHQWHLNSESATSFAKAVSAGPFVANTLKDKIRHLAVQEGW